MAGAGGGRFLLYYAMPLFLLLFLPLLSSVPKVFFLLPPSLAVATPRRARRRKTAMDTRRVGGREDGEEALVCGEPVCPKQLREAAGRGSLCRLREGKSGQN